MNRLASAFTNLSSDRSSDSSSSQKHPQTPSISFFPNQQTLSSSLDTSNLSPTEADFPQTNNTNPSFLNSQQSAFGSGYAGSGGGGESSSSGFGGLSKEQRLRNGEFGFIYDDPRSAFYHRNFARSWVDGNGNGNGNGRGLGQDQGSGVIDGDAPPDSAKTMGSWPGREDGGIEAGTIVGKARGDGGGGGTSESLETGLGRGLLRDAGGHSRVGRSNSAYTADGVSTGTETDRRFTSGTGFGSISGSGAYSAPPEITLPDRSVRSTLYFSPSPSLTHNTSSNRRNPKPAPNPITSRPLNLKTMARGPHGSGKVVVAGMDSLRVLRVSNDWVSDPTGGVPSTLEGRINTSTSSNSSSSPNINKGKNSTSYSSILSSTDDKAKVLSTGPGGTKIEQVLDLWKAVPSKLRGGSTGGGGNGLGQGLIVNAVDWGRGAMGSKIVAACSTGGCLVFDVEKGVLERQIVGDMIRPMLCVALNKVPRQGHFILTGGADNTANLWDLRQRSSTSSNAAIRHEPFGKVRKEALKHHQHPVPVLSLSFAPPGVSGSCAYSYVIGLENGSIFRYDWRNGGNNKVGTVTAAHGNKGVMALEWKGPGKGEGVRDGEDGVVGGPGSGGWLASAGLDKTVKIWDMSDIEMRQKPVRIIRPLHGIRRIAWRPDHDTELAVVSLQEGLATGTTFGLSQTSGSFGSSSSLASRNIDLHSVEEEESRVEVWDVRRGYVAKYLLSKPSNSAVTREKGVVQDISWADEGALQSCSSNGAFEQHDIRNNLRPLSYLPRQAGGWNAVGEFTFTLDKVFKGEVPFDDIKPEYQDRTAEFGVKPKSITESDHIIRQTAATVDVEEFDDEAWTYAAKQYRLSGMSPVELCQWNAEVDELVGRKDYRHLWLLLRQLITEIEAVAAQGRAQQSHRGPSLARRMPARLDSSRTIQRQKRWQRAEDQSTQEMAAGEDSESSDSGLAPRSARLRRSSASSGTSSNSSAEGVSSTWKSAGNLEQNRPLALTIPPFTPSTPAPATTSSEQVTPRASSFGKDAAVPPKGLSKDQQVEDRGVSQPQTGDITVGRRSSPLLLANADRRTSLAPSLHSLMRDSSAKKFDRNQNLTAALEKEYAVKQRNLWIDFNRSFLEDSIERMLQGGEVQISACLLLVGGSVTTFTASRIERILYVYLDLLDRYRLFSCAASVRQAHDRASKLSLSETVFHVKCSKCQKAVDLAELTISDQAPCCRSCLGAVMTCGFCHLPVTGLQVGCLTCGHGGHEDCMSSFLSQARKGAYIDASRMGSRASSAGRTSSPSPAGRTDSPTRLQRQFGDRMRDRSTSATRMLNIPSPYKNEMPQGLLCLSGCGCRCWAQRLDFATAALLRGMP